MGPSGSGKSTALHLAGALDVPTTGTVRVDGVDLATLTARERAALRRDRIGFVFQSYNLVPVMSAHENAASVLALQGVPEAEQRTRVASLLEELGIGDLADRRPDQLSGGQQQRVAIARAVAARPAVVLGDEPTANVDSATAERLLDLIRSLNERHGTTFLLSTHDERVMKRVRRVVTLVDGKVASDETVGG
ncbi:MAG: ATP-binding cassette domain-containing protein [Myxococcales bacterium]|nr:ATP-binding cassette domain-containing protein [Myxococcales bacterium]